MPAPSPRLPSCLYVHFNLDTGGIGAHASTGGVARKLAQRVVHRMVAQFRRPTGFWGQVAGWIMASRSSNRRRNHWAVSLLEIERDDRVLEIGFGPGIAVRALARIATEGIVCGVDHSKEMLRQATRRNAGAIQAGRVDLRLGSVERPPAVRGGGVKK